MECYIIGFIIMLTYTIVEIHETKYCLTSFSDYFILLFGLLIWPVILGKLFYEYTKTLNKIK